MNIATLVVTSILLIGHNLSFGMVKNLIKNPINKVRVAKKYPPSQMLHLNKYFRNFSTLSRSIAVGGGITLCKRPICKTKVTTVYQPSQMLCESKQKKEFMTLAGAAAIVVAGALYRTSPTSRINRALTIIDRVRDSVKQDSLVAAKVLAKVESQPKKWESLDESDRHSLWNVYCNMKDSSSLLLMDLRNADELVRKVSSPHHSCAANEALEHLHKVNQERIQLRVQVRSILPDYLFASSKKSSDDRSQNYAMSDYNLSGYPPWSGKY